MVSTIFLLLCSLETLTNTGGGKGETPSRKRNRNGGGEGGGGGDNSVREIKKHQSAHSLFKP